MSNSKLQPKFDNIYCDTLGPYLKDMYDVIYCGKICTKYNIGFMHDYITNCNYVQLRPTECKNEFGLETKIGLE